MLTIKLESSDGVIFETDVDTIKCSDLIMTMLEACGMRDGDKVPLLNVDASNLRKILLWAEYHRHDPQLPENDEIGEKRTDDISLWDGKFLKVDQETLFQLMLAANYLDIKPLVDVICKTVANMIKGKKPEEIRALFNIRNDFTLAEEDNIRKEIEWSEDLK